MPRRAQPSTARSGPANPPSSPGREAGKAKQRTGRAGSQRSTFSICICLLFIKPSLLEHFGDSNSEISDPSVSFPRRWEQIIPSDRFLSHYLLPSLTPPNTQAQEHRLLHPGSSTNPQQCDTSPLINEILQGLGNYSSLPCFVLRQQIYY